MSENYTQITPAAAQAIAATVRTVRAMPTQRRGTPNPMNSVGGMPGALIYVKLTQTGGAIGTATSASSWTYTAKDLAGNSLGTTLSPLAATRRNGALTAATDGEGYFDATGTFVLLRAWEASGTGSCS